MLEKGKAAIIVVGAVACSGLSAQSYDYDSINRLKGVIQSWGSKFNYYYDAAGNLVKIERAATVTDFGDAAGGTISTVIPVGVDTTGGTLKLGATTADATFPFIWIANSGEGTISKIDTNTGATIAKYRTGPQSGNGNPSRTTVDQDGAVWVGNRDHNTITKVGLWEYDQCVDRNGNGSIETAQLITGNNTPMAWTGSFGDGKGVTLAEDECILQHVPMVYPGVTTPSDIRMIAIDKENNLYVGGTNVTSVFKVNGKTGQVLDSRNTAGSFYGGFVGADGSVWGINRKVGTTVIKVNSSDLSSELINVGINAYGIAPDQYGRVWVTDVASPAFVAFHPSNPAGTLQRFSQSGRYFYANYAQGIATSGDDIFIAGALGNNVVGHYRQTVSNGALQSVALVNNYTVQSGPTGVAVDGKNRVWATNYDSNSVSRITLGSAPPSTATVDTFPVGYHPYNYSDMTGRLVRNVTTRQGTWEATFDSGTAAYLWAAVNLGFKQALPDGTSVTLYAKAADQPVEFGALPFVEIQSGAPLGSAFKGRYMKIKIKLTSNDPAKTPEITSLSLN